MIAEVMFVLGWDAAWLPLYLDGKHRARIGTRDERKLRRRTERHKDRQVELGAPDGFQTALWCWITSPEALEVARMFVPRPSIVLQVGRGSRRLLLWALEAPASYVSVLAANKRLAYRFGVPQKPADPSLLRVPLTCVRDGRTRPAAVQMTYCEPHFNHLGEVVGGLRDPPAPYMERLRRGEV